MFGFAGIGAFVLGTGIFGDMVLQGSFAVNLVIASLFARRQMRRRR